MHGSVLGEVGWGVLVHASSPGLPLMLTNECRVGEWEAYLGTAFERDRV